MKTMKKSLLTALVFMMLVLVGMPLSVGAASKVKLNKTTATLYVGETVKLKMVGTKKKVKWSSTNKKVAVVTQKGKVTAKKAGKATIVAKVGTKKYKCSLTVKAVMTVNKSKITVKDSAYITCTLNEYGELFYSIENSNILGAEWMSWDGNKVKLKLIAKKSGTTTVTITNDYNNETKKIKVTVDKPGSVSGDIFEGIDAQMIIPRNGTNNYYCRLKITNNSGKAIQIATHAYFNGFGCRYFGSDAVGGGYTLQDGYYVILTYYRAISKYEIYDNKWNDMYLDRYSTGYVRIKTDDSQTAWPIFDFDVNGRIYGAIH